MTSTITRKSKPTKIIDVGAGRPYGHVPGHGYLDCEVYVVRAKRGYVATALLTWGSAQGYDEEHGRRETSSFGGTALDAVQDLRREALALAEGDEESSGYIRSALSEALAVAADL